MKMKKKNNFFLINYVFLSVPNHEKKFVSKLTYIDWEIERSTLKKSSELIQINRLNLPGDP